ncbi:MAG: guanosine monophosphate reductase [Deltaproteobacteria bacterium]
MCEKIIPFPCRGFEYSDLSIIPRTSDIRPKDVDISSYITRTMPSELPFIASPMDSVIGFSLAECLLKAGGVPILHAHYNQINTLKENVDKLKPIIENADGKIGLLISPDKAYIDSVKDIIRNNIDIVAIDTLHRQPHLHFEAVARVKEAFPNVEIICGNVVTGEDCEKLIELGADAVRVGMTSASVNTGQDITGCGRCQGSAVYECFNVCQKYNVPMIADGSISNISQVVIALALGASMVMMGKMFASLKESNAKLIKEGILSYKLYQGMSRKNIISEELIPEGIEIKLPISGTFKSEIDKWTNILRIAISRAGCRTIRELNQKSILEYH